MRFRFLSRPLIPALLVWGVGILLCFYTVQHFLMPWVAGQFKNKVVVPNLIGNKPEKAEQASEAMGLAMMLDSTSDFSSEFPAGAIQFQFPEAGTQVKPGRRIWVRISKGPRAVETPSVRGMSLRQAEISLQQAGLKLGAVRYVRNAEVPAGATLGSNPREGSVVDRGRNVDIEVSAGTEEKMDRMPSLLGLSLKQAQKQLTALGFVLGQVKIQFDKKSLPQTVLAQEPKPGSAVNGGSVDLVLSK